jgi:transcriptional antiterminator RfaH
MLRWYVVQTKPRKEEVAAVHLERDAIEVFFPKMETISLRNGKARKDIKALFPNYLFAHFDVHTSYRLVRWSRGVSRVVGFEGGPSPVDDEVIGIIRMRTDSHSVVRRALHLKAKDPIRIRSGPLKDLIGIFDRWVSSDVGRVRVLLNLLSYDASVELHYSQLERIY